MSLLGLRSAKKKGGSAEPAASAPAPAAKPAKTRGVVVEKPPANIYTVLLILSFSAILIGCICLYAEMSAYEFNLKAR